MKSNYFCVERAGELNENDLDVSLDDCLSSFKLFILDLVKLTYYHFKIMSFEENTTQVH